MLEKREYEDDNFFMLRLTARVFAVACLAILFLIIQGEDSYNWLKAPMREMIGIVIFPAGFTAGLLIAWRWELLGGVISLASIALFYAVYGLILSNLSTGIEWWFIFMAIPGALFLAYGIAIRGGSTADASKLRGKTLF